MSPNPYTAHDARGENGGLPVWNVKVLGFDTLVHRHTNNAISHETVKREAERLAEYMNEAYRAGFEAGKAARP